MKLRQLGWRQGLGWDGPPSRLEGLDPQLVLVFAAPSALRERGPLDELRSACKTAKIAGCSTAGEISPFTPGATCALHNQTMTITTVSEG